MSASPSGSNPGIYRPTAQAGPSHGLSKQGSPSWSRQSGGGEGTEVFTPAMRDRQARGKDPYKPVDDGVDDRDVAQVRVQPGMAFSQKEDSARLERRDQAAAFLDNPELLMMYAQSKGDSIPAARLHFMKMLCGYDDAGQAATPAAQSSLLRSSRHREPDKRRVGSDRVGAR